MRATQRQRGFTLLEMLLVIMLLGLLLGGAYGGISAAVRGMRSGEAAIERVDKVRTVQEFLRRQISRTLPFQYAQTQTTGEVFRGDDKFMRFVAPMPGYLSHGGAYVQTLELAQGDDGLQLIFTSTLLNGFSLDKSASGQVSTVVLLDHVRDGKFSYRGLDAQHQLTDWSYDWPDSSATPLMVKIDLTLATGGQIDWPALSIPLMMDSSAQRGVGAAGLRR
ncbi:MAG: prepilin-type N-terminal cleavage/methylation domain-containing protein [Rudaea sp.]